MQLPVYIGMRVFLTRNVNKSIDFVNGMGCDVTGWDAETSAVYVMTDTGYRVSIYPWCDTDLGGVVYYPVRAGYASTIQKWQGAGLKHVTAFLDAANVPGAAYTAMSRVEYGNDLLLAGMLTPEHFTPAK